MSNTVDVVNIQTYESNVRHLAQQGQSRLRPYVVEKNIKAEAHNWDRVSSTAATKKTSRKTPTPDDNTAFSRRKSIPVVYHTGDSTEQEDVTKILIDPNSTFVKAQSMAMKRAFDDEIIAAAVGASRDGDGNSVAFPAGQEIGDGSTELSFDLVTAVSEKFITNEIDPDEGKVMVIGPKQGRKLLQLTEATSSDYNTVQPLATKGYVENWMGYTWVMSNRLIAPDTDEIYCFAMTRRALALQINRDISTKVSEDPTISFAWRIYTFAEFGAIRVEDEHLIRIHLADTV
jgi:hypothetical protein